MLKQYHRILVIILKHIGDVLVATPVFRALKEAYPESQLSVLVEEGTQDMVTLNPFVDEVMVLDRATDMGILGRFFRQAGFLSELRRKTFDLVLELSAGDRGAFLGFVTGATERIGFRPKKRRLFGRQHLFSRLVDIDTTTQHMVDYNLALVKSIGIESTDKRLLVAWSEEDADSCERLLYENGLNETISYVVVHPTSRWLFKAWNSKGYAAVCDHIVQKYRLQVVITSGPDEKERARVREIISMVESPTIDMSGLLSLKQLAFCISNAVLFFGVDSAPMHIAAAVNTPVIALFGPSGDHMWGPWGVEHTIIKKGWDCQPCGRDGCEGSKISRCLESITSQDVFREISIQIGRAHV